MESLLLDGVPNTKAAAEISEFSPQKKEKINLPTPTFMVGSYKPRIVLAAVK